MAKADLTAERLRELLDYDPETGLMTRKVRTSNRIKVGDVVGAFTSDGYLVVRVDGPKYPVHRLAWLHVYGEWPNGEIDHINGVPDDNRLCNLRVVDRTGNTQNTHKTVRADGSLVGVYPSRSRWMAGIQANKKWRRLGTFDTPEEAHAAYIEAKRRLHPTCTL